MQLVLKLVRLIRLNIVLIFSGWELGIKTGLQENQTSHSLRACQKSVLWVYLALLKAALGTSLIKKRFGYSHPKLDWHYKQLFFISNAFSLITNISWLGDWYGLQYLLVLYKHIILTLCLANLLEGHPRQNKSRWTHLVFYFCFACFCICGIPFPFLQKQERFFPHFRGIPFWSGIDLHLFLFHPVFNLFEICLNIDMFINLLITNYAC
jgi:hypothetical protein